MASALTDHLERSLRAPPVATPPKPEKMKHYKVPVATAPTWPQETVPLREFLKAAPRSWTELYQWAIHNRVPEYRLHNQVAWLEGAGLARAQMLGPASTTLPQQAIWRAR
jgi:hypothetical protein